MTNNYIESLEQLFDGEAPLSTEGLKGFFDDSLEFLQELQTKLVSPDEKVREEAVQSSMAMKERLDSQIKQICEKNGLNLDQLTAFAENTETMTIEEQKTIEEMEKKFQAFKTGTP